MTDTATFIADVSDQFRGTASVYKLTPPMDDYDGDPTDYVVVSQANVPYSGYETYIFPCDKNGVVTNWMEMEGSTKGYVSLEDALENAGYRISETIGATT